MDRKLALVFLSVWGTVVGAYDVSAAETKIEAVPPTAWQPDAANVSIGDTIEWIMGPGSGAGRGHGLRITNWSQVKGSVEVEHVVDEQPFNETTGRNDVASKTDGQVLLRLKVKSPLPAPSEIKFDCIIHGIIMDGKISVAPAPVGPTELLNQLDMAHAMMVPSYTGDYFLVAPSAANADRLIGVRVKMFDALDALPRSATAVDDITTVKSFDQPDLHWENDTEQVEIGDEIQWVNGRGTHGLLINNWDEVRDSVEIIQVHDPSGTFSTTGKTPSSSAVDKVYARLKINSIPSTGDTIRYECSFHGDIMKGTVRIVPATEPPVDGSHGNGP